MTEEGSGLPSQGVNPEREGNPVAQGSLIRMARSRGRIDDAQTAILNWRTRRSRSSAVVASSEAEEEISCAEALVCSVDAETCSAEAEEDWATSATWTMSPCICSASAEI